MLLNHESSLFKNVNGPLLMPHVMVYSTPLSPYARAPAQDRVDSDERASLVRAGATAATAGGAAAVPHYHATLRPAAVCAKRHGVHGARPRQPPPPGA